MSTTHQDLVFTVHITSQSYLTELLAASFMDSSGTGFSRAPMEVAATVGTDLFARGSKPTADPIPILIPVVTFVTPSIDSKWIVQPGPGELAFPLNVLTFKRKSGGWFGISWLFGDTTVYTWIPHYEFTPDIPPTPPGQAQPTPLPTRRWIDGAEIGAALGTSGEGGSGNVTNRVNRRASRHAQGFGYIFEDDTRTRTHTYVENGAPVTGSGWERFYLRIMRNPDTIPTRIWYLQFSSGSTGLLITLTSSGSLLLSSYNGFNTATPIGGLGTALALNTWYKIDVLISANKLNILVNGTNVFSGTTGSGLANLLQSTIGGGGVAGENCKAIFHIDDWIGADFPAVGLAPPADLTLGSRVALIGANGFASDHDAASWGNRDWRLARIRPAPGGATGVSFVFTSTTPGARLSITTDAKVEVDAPSTHLGIVAMSVGMYVDKQGGGADGQIGWRLPGQAENIATGGVEPAGSYQYTHRLFRPAGLLMPMKPLGPTDAVDPDPAINGLELIYLKGASTDPAKVQGPIAVVEIIGQFGPEDLPMSNTVGVPEPPPPDGTVTLQRHVGIHNAPYPHSPWAQQLLPPESLTSCKSGTYTGNGTAQDFHFRNPVQFLWIRNNNGYVVWCSSFIAGHIRGQQGISPESILEVLIDPNFLPGTATETNMDLPEAPDNLEQALAESNALAFGFEKNTDAYEPWTHYLEDPAYYWKRMLGWQSEGGPDEAVAGLYAVPPSPWLSTQQQQTLVRVAGSIIDTNTPGTVYTYFGFCDPGVRFCNAGGLIAGNWQTALDSPLDDLHFTPQTALLVGESPNALTTPVMFFKGLGSAANAVSAYNGGAEIANGLTFAQGKLTQLLGIANPNNTQLSYIVFRSDDGSDQTPPAGPQVIWLKTYTGNGANPRTIAFGPFTPSTNRRPMWALVVGHNGTWVMRDPTHTTVNSTQLSGGGGGVTTGITGGGIEQIIVNSLLNQSGVIYDILAFPGSDCDNGTGWSCIGEPPPPPPPPPPICVEPPPCIWNPPPPPPPPPPGGGGAVCSATEVFPIDSDTA